jgi:tetratricopeptide (TPR) repeat protein
LYHRTGRLDQSRQAYEESLALLRQVGNRRSEGVSLGSLADVYRDAGQVEQSERAYEQILAIDREVGNRRSEGVHLCGYGLLMLQLGRRAQALGCWRDGIMILRDSGAAAEIKQQVAAMLKSCARAGVPPLDQTEAAP